MHLMRVLVLIPLIVLMLLVGLFSIEGLSNDTYAHRDGCHRWHSCPSDTGSYACGDLGIDTYCLDRQDILP